MKRGIELVVFVSGLVLMALEIAGGRLLVFDYGGTVFVWGAIIAVVLSGLSIGYYFGGRLADKMPDEKVLAFLILLASLLILIIPFVYSRLVSLIKWAPFMFAPLLIVALLFFLPSVLLGCVSPYAIKLKAKKLEKIGSVVGNLYALATVGSVVGTFLATFVLILFMRIDNVFILLGASLIAVVLVLRKNKKFYFVCLAILLIILLSSLNFSNFQESLDVSDRHLSEEINGSIVFESFYGPVMVKDNLKKGIRGMYISTGVMGEIYTEDKFEPVRGWEYLDFMVKVSVFLEPENVLVLGVGAGIVPTRLSEQYGIDVDAVDINKVVLETAQNYFGLNPSETLRVYNEDARIFLERSDDKYDIVAMDTFKYIDHTYVIPPHLTTKEYFELVEDHLTNGGALVMMMIDASEVNFFNSEYATLSSVFENVYIFDFSMKVIVASNKKIDFPEEMLRDFYHSKIPAGDIYTDDYVPLVS